MDSEPKKLRKKAKSFKRRLGQEPDAPKELRRRLVYYLPAEARAAMYAHLQETGMRKREFVIQCLERYFADRRMKVWMPRSTTPFGERTFMFDEVPNDLWLRVDEASRTRDYTKTLNHYHIVEAAIAIALGLDETLPLYKTHKEIENERTGSSAGVRASASGRGRAARRG